jgi:hypothetical protein
MQMEEARCSRSGDTADGYELVLMSWSKWRSLQATRSECRSKSGLWQPMQRRYAAPRYVCGERLKTSVGSV